MSLESQLLFRLQGAAKSCCTWTELLQ